MSSLPLVWSSKDPADVIVRGIDGWRAHLALEDGVTLTLDAFPGERFPARVDAIVPSADRNRATVRVDIAFARLDRRILPQMAAKAAFVPVNTARRTGS